VTSSRPDAAGRLLAAATMLGARGGIGALSIQGIADAAGVSKALVLYHFEEKSALFLALYEDLCAQSASRLRAAARARDPLEAWQRAVHEEISRGELPLIAALAGDASLRTQPLGVAGRAREEAAADLGIHMLASLDLQPRIGRALLGRVLLRHLDGVVGAFAARAEAATASEDVAAELDAFALGFLALGE
jgi:AcrR family transcriptional regulator